STEQLWQEFLEIIDKQLESDARLKEIVERIAGASSKKGLDLNDEVATELQNLFVETEALQGQARAAYHCLFEDED
ncbi:hypothetical protein ACFLYR_09225, partial [Chloroflexota bacterium]